MPSSVVGGVALRKAALNCRPWVRSLTQVPAGLDELAGADRGRVADHGDQVALAADLDPQHAEAVLGVVERHPLDQAGQRLALAAAAMLIRAGCRSSVRFASRSCLSPQPRLMFARIRALPVVK